MFPFHVSLNRNPSAPLSDSTSFFTAANSSTSPSHVHRKLTKRRRLQSLPDPPNDYRLLPSSAAPIYPDPSSPFSPVAGMDQIPHLHFESDVDHKFLPELQWPQRPGWRDKVGEDLITRWSKMDVSDEVLIAELEKLKNNKSNYFRPGDANDFDDEGYQSYLNNLGNSLGTYHPEDEERKWKRARTTLFCCRELIRTELNYLEGLLQLGNGETITPSPPILKCYLPALVASSIELAVNMLSDPTVYGVSRAFVQAERQLENAFVPWCGIIGEAFSESGRWSGSQDGHRKLVRARETMSSSSRRHKREHPYSHENSMLSHSNTVPTIRHHSHRETSRNDNQEHRYSHSGQSVGKENGVIRLFKRLSLNLPVNSSHSSPSKPSPSVFAAERTSHHRRSHHRRDQNHDPNFDVPTTRTHHTPSSDRDPRSRYHHHHHHHHRHHHHQSSHPNQAHTSRRSRGHRHRRVKIATAKDLAIQPTQRVVRYVLLFRDLLSQTSDGCLSRPYVERALESATRIAKKCDRAQGNVAFLRGV